MGCYYEGTKEILDIKGFSTPENVALPNDDLDLQLVWLKAVEKFGARGINAKVLGEYWLSFISPYWNEYGRCKLNMQIGLIPPLSGDVFNTWKHSNGGWIRTEIWACLAPGEPNIAAKYAREDASVDHGTGEGTFSAMFVAALESAAFVVKDLRKLIEIGLSKIPGDCRTAQSVKYVIDCYDKGKDYRDTRNEILKLNSDIGTGWFEAPSNIAYAIIGLLWGEGDFKKTMIYTINCGDDTDCTAGMVGSILGIMGGTSIIPEDWKKHIGDNIETVAITKGVLPGIAKNTCTDLTDLVCKLAPHFLFECNSKTEITGNEEEIEENVFDICKQEDPLSKLYDPQYPNSYRIDFNYASAIVMFDAEPTISPNETVKFRIRFINNVTLYGNMQYFLKLRFLNDTSLSLQGPKTVFISRKSPFDVELYHDQPYAEADFEITAGDNVESINRIVIEVSTDNRITTGYIPVTLIGK